MMEGCSNMQPHPGSERKAAADGRQPETEIVEINSFPTPELGHDLQMADEATNTESRQDGEMADIEAQDPCNGSSRSASLNSHEVRIKIDFEFLWRLRKYLLLLAVLAVSVTYNAGLSPPGGFWTDDSPGHHASDPLLPSKFFPRYEGFFYCNATAFAASLVLIILLLSRGVSNQHLWLRAMQVTMILDLFSLMGAYAAGSCRALKSSVYILVLVFAVFLYVWIHILVFIKVVPKWLKEGVQKFIRKIVEKLQTMLKQVLSICHVPAEQRSIQNEEEEIEEARKFILMLSTFVATITYQAGMNPPGGFWAENNYGYRPATFVLRRHNLRRFNIFTCCNASSFVASLVTIILLLSTKLSRHGIRTLALFVCVIAELFGLIIAYAAGSCRDVATSLSVIFIIAVVLICALILVIFFQSRTVTMWIDNAVKPGFDNFLKKLSWPRENRLSHGNRGPLSSPQKDADNGNSGDQSIGDVKPAPTSDLDSIKDSMLNMPNQLHEQKENLSITTVHSSSADVPSTKGSMPEQGLSDPMSAPGDLTVSADVSETEHNVAKNESDRAEQTQLMSGHHHNSEADEEVSQSENGILSNNEGTRNQGRSSDESKKNPDDVRLKKSRTYLLLLAVLAVSLTYQAGLNPPGGFWTSNDLNHSAGDPILEDNYHERYLAFFYFNAIAFLASLVMLIMLLNRKMSNKVIKRRALQTAMITDLLALMGTFVVGSCREKTKSIYISVVIFFVIAYVPLHVWASRYVVPEQWKQCLAQSHVMEESPRVGVHNDAKAASEKDLERRRNLLFILAILGATVTYQAGLNPPGGIWPDGNIRGGKPGNPVLQDSHPKRYDIFYYSNAVSFVSSVAVIVLLINRESCEHGIKSYALRVCLIAGLLGLLIAYSAGSFRKVKSIGYLVIIAAAVLICLLTQVLVLSSTNDALEWPAWSRWLQKISGLDDSNKSLDSPGQSKNESNAVESVPLIHENKEKKRHKYLMLLAILAASIAYQAGLNPPGGFWSDDSPDGYKAGNPVLKDIHSRRYMVFYVSNSFSFMASIAVIMLLLIKSVRKNKVPLQALFLIMILDLLALMTAYAAGSCRKLRTSIFVFMVVCGVVLYLVIVIILSSGIAKWLKERKGRWPLCWRCPRHDNATE